MGIAMSEQERPLIQIDDLVRPMNDEEYAEWQICFANRKPLPISPNELPE